MRNFVSNNPADGSVIEVGGTIFTKESALKDASREFWKKKGLDYFTLAEIMQILTDRILKWGIIGVDNSWSTVWNPICLVNGFTQLFECIISAKNCQIEGIA